MEQFKRRNDSDRRRDSITNRGRVYNPSSVRQQLINLANSDAKQRIDELLPLWVISPETKSKKHDSLPRLLELATLWQEKIIKNEKEFTSDFEFIINNFYPAEKRTALDHCLAYFCFSQPHSAKIILRPLGNLLIYGKLNYRKAAAPFYAFIYLIGNAVDPGKKNLQNIKNAHVIRWLESTGSSSMHFSSVLQLLLNISKLNIEVLFEIEKIKKLKGNTLKQLSRCPFNLFIIDSLTDCSQSIREAFFFHLIKNHFEFCKSKYQKKNNFIGRVIEQNKFKISTNNINLYQVISFFIRGGNSTNLLFLADCIVPVLLKDCENFLEFNDLHFNNWIKNQLVNDYELSLKIYFSQISTLSTHKLLKFVFNEMDVLTKNQFELPNEIAPQFLDNFMAIFPIIASQLLSDHPNLKQASSRDTITYYDSHSVISQSSRNSISSILSTPSPTPSPNNTPPPLRKESNGNSNSFSSLSAPRDKILPPSSHPPLFESKPLVLFVFNKLFSSLTNTYQYNPDSHSWFNIHFLPMILNGILSNSKLAENFLSLIFEDKKYFNLLFTESFEQYQSMSNKSEHTKLGIQIFFEIISSYSSEIKERVYNIWIDSWNKINHKLNELISFIFTQYPGINVDLPSSFYSFSIINKELLSSSKNSSLEENEGEDIMEITSNDANEDSKPSNMEEENVTDNSISSLLSSSPTEQTQNHPSTHNSILAVMNNDEPPKQVIVIEEPPRSSLFNLLNNDDEDEAERKRKEIEKESQRNHQQDQQNLTNQQVATAITQNTQNPKQETATDIRFITEQSQGPSVKKELTKNENKAVVTASEERVNKNKKKNSVSEGATVKSIETENKEEILSLFDFQWMKLKNLFYFNIQNDEQLKSIMENNLISLLKIIPIQNVSFAIYFYEKINSFFFLENCSSEVENLFLIFLKFIYVEKLNQKKQENSKSAETKNSFNFILNLIKESISLFSQSELFYGSNFPLKITKEVNFYSKNTTKNKLNLILILIKKFSFKNKKIYLENQEINLLYEILINKNVLESLFKILEISLDFESKLFILQLFYHLFYFLVHFKSENVENSAFFANSTKIICEFVNFSKLIYFIHLIISEKNSKIALLAADCFQLYVEHFIGFRCLLDLIPSFISSLIQFNDFDSSKKILNLILFIINFSQFSMPSPNNNLSSSPSLEAEPSSSRLLLQIEFISSILNEINLNFYMPASSQLYSDSLFKFDNFDISTIINHKHSVTSSVLNIHIISLLRGIYISFYQIVSILHASPSPSSPDSSMDLDSHSSSNSISHPIADGDSLKAICKLEDKFFSLISKGLQGFSFLGNANDQLFLQQLQLIASFCCFHSLPSRKNESRAILQNHFRVINMVFIYFFTNSPPFHILNFIFT